MLLIGPPQSSQAFWEILSKWKLGTSQVIWTCDFIFHRSFLCEDASKTRNGDSSHLQKIDFLDFRHKYSAAVFTALCGVCEKRNFKEISTNLCLVLFPDTSLQNKQNTHWLRLFSQVVVICDKIRRCEINFLFTSYQLAEPRIRGKSSRNYLIFASCVQGSDTTCRLHYRPNCKKLMALYFGVTWAILDQEF